MKLSVEIKNNNNNNLKVKIFEELKQEYCKSDRVERIDRISTSPASIENYLINLCILVKGLSKLNKAYLEKYMD